MNTERLAKYWSYAHKTLLISIIVASAFSYFFGAGVFVYFLLLNLRDYYHFDARLFEINRLKSRGLTEEDAENIRFVKKWEQTRIEGKISYCLFDGGVIQGGIIAVFLCLMAIGIYGVQKLFAQPSYMFIVTGGAYLFSGLIASLFYRYLWKQNEKRFRRLTQFEHLIS
ncbi:hypothetical protein [Mucilaginibacter psychrotolerans]|uniref:Uncharacterized protein n=1 Tax=Mucilaginibacter psychrotolerans TaxID=1524096 RepID=A0A4Y8SD51_9SPHI|nr:hypothetical protein [Mucilaginibacter psychrotolerans]TFF36286.1 hypothetical protein E2R66_15730 [Mucilaginibacter psychrotolerans]